MKPAAPARSMSVTFTDGTTELYDAEPFTDGAQGSLYMSQDRRSVLKLYHQTDSFKLERLTRIIDDYNVTRIKPNDSALKRPDPTVRELFAWPNAITRQPRLGVRMRNVNFSLEHKPLSWWLMPKAFKRVPGEMRGNWLDRTRVASGMARAAWKLHASGLCHSDFSGNNFLANVAQQRVVLIDLDSLVIPHVLAPEMLGTADYMAPEIVMSHQRGDSEARPTIFTDLHSLAVLIYQLLVMRHPLKGPQQHDSDPERDEVYALGEKALYIEDPNNPANRPEGKFVGAWTLGEEVEALMRRAFTNGLRTPTVRPLASDWEAALMRMYDQTIPCINPECPGKAFVLLRDRPAVCPWCGTALAYPHTVPVFRMFYNAGQAGHFQPDKLRVVGWQGRTLHVWHVQADRPESGVLNEADRRPVAEVQFSKSEGWRLVNHGIDHLRVGGQGWVQRVKPEQAVALEDGQQWLLGTGDSARLAVVHMQALQ